MEVERELNLTTKDLLKTSQMWTFHYHFYKASYQQRLDMDETSPIWFDIPMNFLWRVSLKRVATHNMYKEAIKVIKLKLPVKLNYHYGISVSHMFTDMSYVLRMWTSDLDLVPFFFIYISETKRWSVSWLLCAM